MNVDAARLREKGWSEAEISHAKKVMGKVKRRKHPHTKALDEALFWGLLMLSVFAMASVAYLIIPLFMFAKSIVLYPTLVGLGIGLGLLFRVVIKDLDHLKTHHHATLTIVTPVTGIAIFIAMLGKFTDATALGGVHHSPLLVGLTFAAAFMAPYAYHLLTKAR
ncbi:MAG: hypothetical protein ACLFO2_01515 [Candidatus Woesearchaeota archaeon]